MLELLDNTTKGSCPLLLCQQSEYQFSFMKTRRNPNPPVAFAGCNEVAQKEKFLDEL
jgi:hypothetical protein